MCDLMGDGGTDIEIPDNMIPGPLQWTVTPVELPPLDTPQIIVSTGGVPTNPNSSQQCLETLLTSAFGSGVGAELGIGLYQGAENGAFLGSSGGVVGVAIGSYISYYAFTHTP